MMKIIIMKIMMRMMMILFLYCRVALRIPKVLPSSIVNRYIEIFRSSLSEVRASIGPKMRGGPMGGFNQRPAPYTRGDRFGGMNRFSNNGRGSRNRGDSFRHVSKFGDFARTNRNKELLYNSRSNLLRMYFIYISNYLKFTVDFTIYFRFH